MSTNIVHRQQGFTLVELLVAMVVMGVLVLALATIFQTQLASSVANQDETEQQINVQAVANMLSHDIAMAGFGNVSANPFVHANAASEDESDTLTIRTAAMRGSAIQTFVISAGGGGDEIYVRCWGWEGKGNFVDPVRDAYVDANRPLFLWFINPANGEPIDSMTNPVEVSTSDLVAGDNCDGEFQDSSRPDINNDGTTDSFIRLTINGTVSGLARGTTVYGVRAAPTGGSAVYNTEISYTVDMTNKILTRNGIPVLLGVEDFQVRYRTFNADTQTETWHNDLSGVDTRTIDQVQYGLVVRHARPSPHNQRDPRSEIETFDHTIELSDEDRNFARKQYVFTVRPRNNAL